MPATKHAIGDQIYIFSNDATPPAQRTSLRPLVITAHGLYNVIANPLFDGTDEQPHCIPGEPKVMVPAGITLKFCSPLNQPAREEELIEDVGRLRSDPTLGFRYVSQTVEEGDEIMNYILTKYRGETMARPKPMTGAEVYNYIDTELLQGSNNFDVLTPRNRLTMGGKAIILDMSTLMSALITLSCYDPIYCSFCRVMNFDGTDGNTIAEANEIVRQDTLDS